MEYRCRLATPRGEIVEGVYAADSEARLRRELEEKGLYVLSLKPRGVLPGLSAIGTRRRRPSARQFLVFNQELATLLRAGMPLVQSLDILRQRVTDETFKAVLDTVHERVKGGAALSEAFAEHGTLFPAVYAASLQAGERSGDLDAVIRRYVAYERILGTVRRRTISALIYPAILVAMMGGLVAIIVVWVVPAFSAFYADFDRPLPWLTRAIVGLSTALVAHIWLALGAAAATAAAVVLWVRRSRALVDRWLLELPAVGETVRKFVTAQLARTLATLLGGGIPLVNALDTTARSLSNRHLSAALDDVRRRVQEGESFSGALRGRAVLPEVAVKMIEVGESTGALQEMLTSVAEFFDEEIETEVARFITLIEPVLLVIMGAIIAFVILALYLPLFEMGTVLTS